MRITWADAFRDAELLARALDDGIAGGASLEERLARYEQQRNAASKPFHDFTIDTAQLNSLAIEQIELLRALQHDPVSACQFFGVLTHVVKPTEFFAPKNVFRMLGMRGMAKILVGKLVRQSPHHASA